MTKPLISICIPVLNEESNIEKLLQRLNSLADDETDYQFEFLLTDNASEDNTFELLSGLAKTDDRIRVLRFSRNFGFQKSILTNYQNSRGVAAIQVDADMQDPPEMISAFLRSWEKGFKVVYGIRKGRKEFFLLNWGRKLFYALISNLADNPVPRGAGDFRLIDRVILDQLSTISEQTPYLRGMIADLGYPQKGIVYNRNKREAGKSKFKLFSLIEFGIDGITAQSIRPLRYMTLTGIMISSLSVLVFLYYLIGGILFFQDLPSGFITLTLLTLFSVGINAFFLGLIGEYVGRIFNNTRGLPFTIVEKEIENGQLKDLS